MISSLQIELPFYARHSDHFNARKWVSRNGFYKTFEIFIVDGRARVDFVMHQLMRVKTVKIFSQDERASGVTANHLSIQKTFWFLVVVILHHFISSIFTVNESE